MPPVTIKTDRSRIETYQRCHRRRYLEYHFNGMGIVRRKLSLPLLVGQCVHLGLAQLLHGGDDVLAHAVKYSLMAFDGHVAKLELDIGLTEDQYQVAQEQKNLIEGLLTCFHLTALPKLLATYEVLEVEKEEEVILTATDSLVLKLMARTDAVVRHKEDGDLYILSFKTASGWDSRKDKAASTDIQGLSEAFAVEQRLGQKIMGVQMIHLIKGNRRQDKEGKYVQYSPLIRGYRKYTPTGGVEWAHSWEYTDQSGVKHRLGRGWEPINVAESYPTGVQGWVADLSAGLIQPEAGDILTGQVVMPPPYFRQQEDMDSWLTSAVEQEVNIHEDVQLLQQNGGLLLAAGQLDRYFPMYRHSCHYPSDCQFLGVCYGSAQAKADPLSTGEYEVRTPNHSQELS